MTSFSRATGNRIEIVAVRGLERDEPFTVYNFTVDGTHNYYATAVDALVHNCGEVGVDANALSDGVERIPIV